MSLKISSNSQTGDAKRTTSIHSLKERGTIKNIFARGAMYIIRKWSPNDTAMATRRYGLTNGVIVKRERSSEIALRALNISMVTSTESDSVEAFTCTIDKAL